MQSYINKLAIRLSGYKDQHKAEAITMILERFLDELEKAEHKHPNWPTDPVHAASILAEECGEVVKAGIDFYYKDGHHDTLFADLDLELMQTGAMAIRTSLNIDNYKTKIDPINATQSIHFKS